MSFSNDLNDDSSLLSVPSTKKSRKTSPVHEHCRTPTEAERREKPEKKWLWCRHCSYNAQSTTNMNNHLSTKHEIFLELQSPLIRTQALSTVDSLYSQLLFKLGTKEAVDNEIFRRTINKEVVIQTLLDLIIVRRLPLSCVEWPELHALVQALNPAGKDFVPTSHNTIKTSINTWYSQAKDLVRKRLQSAQTRIHLAVDIWTSPSHDLLLGVTASFTDVQGSFHNILLGLRIVRGHSGENQWLALLPLLQEYGIEDKVGIVIGDNATTNDTLCRTMAQWLQSEKKINWNQTYSRLRCAGHIINLIVQAFLFPTKEDEYEMASYDQNDQSDEELHEGQLQARATAIRTRMGVLGKAHNIVIHIRSSPQRTAEFKNKAGRTIPLNNRTRWNSWLMMLQVVLEEKIIFFVQSYAVRHIENRTLDRRDELSQGDISLLHTIKTYLEVFESATLFLQGQQATIERVYEAIDTISAHINDCIENQKKYKLPKVRVQSSKEKLESYIIKLDASPYYAVARILNPESRTTWIKDPKDQFRANKLWDQFRREHDLILTSYNQEYTQEEGISNRFEQLRKNLKEKQVRRPQSQDEFECYCSEPVSYDLKISPIEWWLQDSQKKRWPQLSSWAIDILSIPSMSDKPERIFSGCRRTVSWDKTAISAEFLEQLECGRDWKNGDVLINNF